MANDFSKEERVAFEDLLEGFNDAEVMARNVRKYTTDQKTMERTGDVIWRPQPYILNTFDGQDQSGNFNDKTGLAVPASIGIEKSAPWIMSATELRDALQEKRLGDAAKQKLASDINVAILNVASAQGTVVVARTTAASGYDDLAEVDAVLNELGIPSDDRVIALSSRDYNGMASDLAGRETMNAKPVSAYERSHVGLVAGFDTFKLDYANRIAVAAGGSITIDLTSAANFHTPKAVTLSPTTSERLNVDNRTQTVTVSATTSVAVGDCFTITGLQSVHHITKQATGQLKTFRVIAVPSSTTLTISPPLIDPDSGAGAESEVQYQNVDVVTSSATAAINWLNIDAANINPFWHKDAIEILPGRYAVPTGSGMSVLRGSTDSGIEIAMFKQTSIDNIKTKYRLDVRFGVVNKAPEMSGILLFAQTA